MFMCGRRDLNSLVYLGGVDQFISKTAVVVCLEEIAFPFHFNFAV